MTNAGSRLPRWPPTRIYNTFQARAGLVATGVGGRLRFTMQEDPDWDRYVQQMQRDADNDKALAAQYAIQILRRHAMTCVLASYSGNGDSGQVESLMVCKLKVDPQALLKSGLYLDDTQCAFDSQKTQALDELPFPGDFPRALRSTVYAKGSLADCLTALAEQFTPCGYEDGEGGQGVVLFDARLEMVHCLHGTNHVEVHYDCETVPAQSTCQKVSSKHDEPGRRLVSK